MNIHLLREIDDANSKFSAYFGLLDYRYKNLCAKADGASLMPVTVIADGFECNIEDVAMVAKPNDYQLAVIPTEERYLRDLIEGIFEAHPEFKMKIMVKDKDGVREVDESETESTEDGEKFLLYTMPDMDKDRRDLLRQGVNGLYEECNTKVKLVNADAMQRMEEGSFICTQKDMDEGRAELKKSYDLIKENIDKLREMKLEEIEEAYHRYLEGQSADGTKAEEDYDVSMNMRMEKN